MVTNILHLNGAKSIQEQLVNNRRDLDDSIAQLLKISFWWIGVTSCSFARSLMKLKALYAIIFKIIHENAIKKQ